MSQFLLAFAVGLSALGVTVSAAPKAAPKSAQAQSKPSARQAGEQHLHTALTQTRAGNASGAIQSLAAAAHAFDGPHPHAHPHLEAATQHLQAAVKGGSGDKAAKDLQKAAAQIQDAIRAHAQGGHAGAAGGSKKK